jgi:methylated-DNA-[protein]-cysteine S-methyltransferase
MRVAHPGFQAKLPTPFALIGVRTEEGKVAEIVYLPRSAGAHVPVNALAEKVCKQIEKYLADPKYRFKLPLKQVGTAFQHGVWKMVAAIPSGQTRSYGDVARLLRTGPRAVGHACGANYFSLVIPCHRVVGSNGIGGFGGPRGAAQSVRIDTGSDYFLDAKRWLIAHENETTL